MLRNHSLLVACPKLDDFRAHLEELTDHMRRMVGPIATPDEIYFVSKLPKTRSGKIMRRVLRVVASNLPIGDVTTLEDEASVEEIVRAYQELKKAGETE